MESKKCPRPANLNQNSGCWAKFESNLWDLRTFWLYVYEALRLLGFFLATDHQFFCCFFKINGKFDDNYSVSFPSFPASFGSITMIDFSIPTLFYALLEYNLNWLIYTNWIVWSYRDWDIYARKLFIWNDCDILLRFLMLHSHGGEKLANNTKLSRIICQIISSLWTKPKRPVHSSKAFKKKYIPITELTKYENPRKKQWNNYFTYSLELWKIMHVRLWVNEEKAILALIFVIKIWKRNCGHC